MLARTGRSSTGVGYRHPVDSSQGAIDDRIDEAGVSIMAPGRSAVLCC